SVCARKPLAGLVPARRRREHRAAVVHQCRKTPHGRALQAGKHAAQRVQREQPRLSTRRSGRRGGEQPPQQVVQLHPCSRNSLSAFSGGLAKLERRLTEKRIFTNISAVFASTVMPLTIGAPSMFAPGSAP